ncbi:hypothetical protein QJS10_CPA09g00810 [Acorus calamus]|uniref:Uncharacterized protein n=1 Tax=Acorus calamus TaxID=4465 RepID=A0AAV9E6D0_ACOCL|nr:hypothetical protein QJS10_CPA09g00810 [Acorus calamus]
MRGVNRLTTAAKPPYLSTSSSAFFSTSSGGGGGRGRGRGSSSGPPQPQRVPGQTLEAEDDSETPPPPPLGHGRGRLPPIPSSPLLPSFSSWNSSASHSAGRGRPSPDAPPPPPPSSHPRQPIFFRSRDEGGGLGRGKPSQPSDVGDENRHIRRRPQPPPPRPGAERPGREEAVKKAMDVLRRGDGATAAAPTRGGRRGGRGRGTRGRGGGGGRRYDRDAVYQDYVEGGGVVDDEAVIEDAKKRLEKTLGPEKMAELEEILEEIKDSVLPDMEVEECWHKFEAQLMIDMEPEYMMEFDRNPDIDEEHEQPAMSLRDALESIKPTLMRADGIKNEEEWEVHALCPL